MEDKNLRSKREVAKTSTAKTMLTFVGIAFALSAFSGYMYWSFHDTQKTIASLKRQKENLIHFQKTDCDDLIRRLDKIEIDEIAATRSEAGQEGGGMLLPTHQHTNNTVEKAQLEASKDSVCNKHKAEIEAIEKELNRILVSFS